MGLLAPEARGLPGEDMPLALQLYLPISPNLGTTGVVLSAPLMTMLSPGIMGPPPPPPLVVLGLDPAMGLLEGVREIKKRVRDEQIVKYQITTGIPHYHI